MVFVCYAFCLILQNECQFSFVLFRNRLFYFVQHSRKGIWIERISQPHSSVHIGLNFLSLYTLWGNIILQGTLFPVNLEKPEPYMWHFVDSKLIGWTWVCRPTSGWMIGSWVHNMPALYISYGSWMWQYMVGHIGRKKLNFAGKLTNLPVNKACAIPYKLRVM